MTGSLTPSFTEQFLGAIGSLDQFGPTLQILDVGTGTARIPVAICRRRNGIKITAVDRAAGILRRARRRVAREGLEDAIRVDQADAGELPYAERSFDAVISNGLVHHLPNRIAALCEMVRVLRPGGLLFVRDSLPQSDAETIASTFDRIVGKARCASAAVRIAPGALSIEEARTLASAAGLPHEWVRHSAQRHWLLAGRILSPARACCSVARTLSPP